MGTKCRIRFPHCYAPLVVMALMFLSGTGGQQDQTRQRLMKLFEEALVNSSKNLYALQDIYFNPSSNKSPALVCLHVTVTVDKIKDPTTPDPSCIPAFANNVFSSTNTLQLRHDEIDTPHLSDLLNLPKTGSAFCAFETSFYSIMKALASSSSSDNNDYDKNDASTADRSISIHIDGELEDMPCYKDAVYALRIVLVWAKAYARAGASGMPIEKQEMDRSSVSDYNVYEVQHVDSCEAINNPLVDSNNMGTLILCIFVFSNLLLVIFTFIFAHIIISTLQKQGKRTKHVYQASATVVTFVNLVILAGDIVFMLLGCYVIPTATSFFDIRSFLFMINDFRFFKVPILFIILTLETPFICYTAYNVYQTNKKCYRIAHAFAFCQLIWFVHRLVNATIISIFYFVISPAQTLGVVTLLFSIIASAIAFVYIIINKGCSRTSCKYISCAAVIGIIICGLLVVITLVYITFVDNGLKSAGMGGLILSLVPPLIVFMIGLFIKRRYSRFTSITSSENETEDLERGQRSNTPINDSNGREDSERQPLISPHPD